MNYAKKFLLSIALGPVLALTSWAEFPSPTTDSSGRFGYKDAKGSIVIPCGFSLAGEFDHSGLAPVNQGFAAKGKKILNYGKWGVINDKGTIVVPCQYAQMQALDYGSFAVSNGGTFDRDGYLRGAKWGVIEKDGKVVVPLKYECIGAAGYYLVSYNEGGDFMGYPLRNSAVPKGKPGRWGLVDRKGKQFTAPQFSFIEKLSSGEWLAQDAKQRLYGLLDPQGKTLIGFEYQELFEFCLPSLFRVGDSSREVAVAKKAGKFGLINRKNSPVVPFIYDNISETGFKKDCIPVELNGRKFEIDPEGREIQPAPSALTNAYDHALRQAKESRARATAYQDFVYAVLASNLSEASKSKACRTASKQLIELDFFALWDGLMGLKLDRLPKTSLWTGMSFVDLNSQQSLAFKDMTQHFLGNFGAWYNDKGAQASYPKHLPQPGFGWGNTVSSDPGASASADDRMMFKSKAVEHKSGSPTSQGDPKHTYQEYVYFNNRHYYVWDGQQVYLAKITSPDWYGRRFHTRQLYLGSFPRGSSVSGIKITDVDSNNWPEGWISAEVLFDETRVKYAGQPITCQCCQGDGFTTSTYSHTNDYTYTLGQTHTYYWSQRQRCYSCQGRGRWFGN